MKRLLKRLIYGAFYLAVFGVIILLTPGTFLKKTPPVAEEARRTSPIPEIPAPTLVFENLKTVISGEEIRVTGVLKNESPQVLRRVKIRAIIFDEEGNEIFPLGISEEGTVEENIRAFEVRSFTVFFPKDRGLAGKIDVGLTEVFYVIE